MKSISLTTVSFFLFFLCTISHALYLFTDLTHIANVDHEADDDYRGAATTTAASKLTLGPENPNSGAQEKVSARLGALLEERSGIPPALRMFPRQCRPPQKAENHHLAAAEMKVDRNKVVRNRAHWPKGKIMFRSNSRNRGGADVDGRGGIMMTMFKRPHFLKPRQRLRRPQSGPKPEESASAAAGAKSEEAAATTKRPEREEGEKEKERENLGEVLLEEALTHEKIGVVSKIRKFLDLS